MECITKIVFPVHPKNGNIAASNKDYILLEKLQQAKGW
jgi:hypothetical protein